MAVLQNVKSSIAIKYIDRVVSSELFWVGTFAVLTFLAAQVSVPAQPVPFTLQTMLVVLSGAFLGSKNGAYSQVAYIALGAMGLPVFAGFSSVLSLFGPTAGYLLAFPLGAFVAGAIIERKKSFFSVFMAMALANIVIVAIGTGYLSLFFHKSFNDVLMSGGLIFSVWDLIKISAAASVYFSISKKYSKLPV